MSVDVSDVNFKKRVFMVKVLQSPDTKIIDFFLYIPKVYYSLKILFCTCNIEPLDFLRLSQKDTNSEVQKTLFMWLLNL